MEKNRKVKVKEMNIKLKNLSIKNFKGIKDLIVDFDNVTNIFGENGTGKTSIFDAFYWLLFDKDSQDRSTFDIKPLDENNEVIHGVESSVIGTFEIDGVELTLQKTYKEKWTKPRGQTELVFNGNTTDYFINETPANKGPFKTKVAEVVDESIFKLLTNPYAFTSLHWTEQKEILFAAIGGFNDDEVYDANEKMAKLKELMGDKDMDDFKATVKSTIKKSNEELKNLPTRIDEANNSVVVEDFDALELEADVLRTKLSDVEKEIAAASSTPEWMSKKKTELADAKSRAVDVKTKLTEATNDQPNKVRTELSQQNVSLSTISTDISSKESRVKSINSDIERLTRDIKSDEEKVVELTEENNKLRPRVAVISAEVFEFDDSTCDCPTCKQRLPEGDIQTQKKNMFDNFEAEKAKRINKIQVTGKGNNEKIKSLNDSIKVKNDAIAAHKIELGKIDDYLKVKRPKATELEVAINKLNEELKTFSTVEQILKNNAEYQRCLADIADLEKEVNEPTDLLSETIVLQNNKSEIQSKIDGITKRLAPKEANKKIADRIVELSNRERELSNIIADLENQLFSCEEFMKLKAGMLDEAVNSKFEVVKFRLFNTLVNGGIEECCQAMVNGVPFANVNHAGQVNAGLDIIKTLSSHYETVAPIFIDNRESVNRIIELDSQVVNLIVTEDKELRIGGTL